MKSPVVRARSFASALAVLGLGCTSPEIPPKDPVTHILIGHADTFTVHSREPVQLPVRAFDPTGREVAAPRVNVTWMSGDSIPVSSAGAVTCLKRGNATVGASIDSAFARVVVRCLPVGSVRMLGPLDILLSDSSQQLHAEVVGLDGKPMGAVPGMTKILHPSVIRVEAGRVIPVSAGGTLLSFRVGDEGATIAVHVYEEVATLDGLRPEQDHVAVSLRLRRGESRSWTLPVGTWMIGWEPHGDFPDGAHLDVQGLYCQGSGPMLCLSKAGTFLRVSHARTSNAGELHGMLLLRRTNGSRASPKGR